MSDFPYLVISNTRQVAARDRHRGYLGWSRGTKPLALRGPSPNPPPIPRSDWTARIKAAFPTGPRAMAVLPAKDQNGLSLCWAYGSTRALEVERSLQNLPELDLAPESVAGPLTGWRNEGGYAYEAMLQIEQFGACERSFQDSPHSLNPRRWQVDWTKNAAQHEVVTWNDLELSDQSPAFDEVITALLGGHPVAAGLGWWGHLVCFVAPVLLPADAADPNTPDGSVVGVLFQNSWGQDWPTAGANGYACLTERLATPDGAAVPVVAGAEGQ